MSSLGDMVREIRGKRSQRGFADLTGLSLRTICKLEAGELVRLETLRRIARACRLNEAKRLELMAAGLRVELGPDVYKLSVEVKAEDALLTDRDYLPGRIQVLVRELSRRQQEQVLQTLQRPEVLACLKHLNQLYEAVQSGTASKTPARAS